MKRSCTWLQLLFVTGVLASCSNPNAESLSFAPKNTPPDTASTAQYLGDDASEQTPTQKEILPLHGELNLEKIGRYYPGILDTVKDRRTMGAEAIDLKYANGLVVSLLHNTGTFDQMFLCTHNNQLQLIDSYYIGKSTMFDAKSHTIAYHQVGDGLLEFHHVDWGYSKKNEELDTLKCVKYTLAITAEGRIVKK